MTSRYYKAYGGPVYYPPGHAECVRQVEALPKFKGLAWYKSLLTRATAAQEEEKRRLVNECMKKKYPGGVPPPSNYDIYGKEPTPLPIVEGDLSDLISSMIRNPLTNPYSIAVIGVGLVIVGVLIGRAIR